MDSSDKERLIVGGNDGGVKEKGEVISGGGGV